MKEAVLMLRFLQDRLRPLAQCAIQALGKVVSRWCKPLPASPLVGTIADLARSKPQLVAENLLLRQHLLMLTRAAKGPHWTRADRALVVVLASRVQHWREALLIRPDTVLRLFWKAKSRAPS